MYQTKKLVLLYKIHDSVKLTLILVTIHFQNTFSK